MKVKVIRSGKVYHVENTVPVALMVEAGLLEQVVDEPKPFKPGVALWRVVQGSKKGQLSIDVSCPECKQKDAIVAQPYMRKVSRASDETQMVVAHPDETYRFAHCRKRESIPKEILDQYRQLARQEGTL